MSRAPVLISAVFVILATAACASAGSSSGGQLPAGSPSAAAGAPSAAAGSPSAASAPCLTHSCVVSILEQSLVGLVAKDGSVITKAVCFKSSVRHNPGDTYTASCHVTYTDQTVYSGYATLLVAQQKVSWQPVEQVQ